MEVPQSTQPPDESGPKTVKKTNTALESVQADVVQINQGSANQVSTQTATVRNSLVRQIDGDAITVDNSALGVAHGNTIHATDSGLGIVSAAEADITGNVGVMVGQSVSFTNHNSGLVIARETHGSSVHSIIFLTGQSYAPVETIVDQRSIALFGLATGIAMGLVFSLFRLLKR